MGRAATASILSLAMALGITACSNDYTVSYVYMVTSKTTPEGLINGYQVDYQSGLLRPLADSPISTGGRDTVGIVAAPNDLFLYTVNNFDSDVVEFGIGTDGKLYPWNTYNTTGSLPTAAAIDAAGKFLYVTFTYQNTSSGGQLYTPANPGPGGLSIFPMNSDNTLGTPTTVNLGRNPVGIATSPVGNYVYVIEQDSATSANLLGFTENPGDRRADGDGGGDDQSGQRSLDRVRQRGESERASGGQDGDPSLRHRQRAEPGGVVFNWEQWGACFDRGRDSSDRLRADGHGAGPERQVSLCSGVQRECDRRIHRGRGRAAGAFYGGGNGGGWNRTDLCDHQRGAKRCEPEPWGVSVHVQWAGSNVSGEQLNPADGSLDQIPGSPFSGSALATCIVTVPAFPLR